MKNSGSGLWRLSIKISFDLIVFSLIKDYTIDEKEVESSVNDIQAALHPPNLGAKNKDIFQLLNESGIQYHNQSDSQG